MEVGSAKILVTSRPETSIADYLRDHFAREIKIGVKDTKTDIKNYVKGQLDSPTPAGVGASGRLKKRLPVQDPQVRDFIIDVLSEKSDGMFLWTDLQLNLLFRQRNEEDVLEVLGSLPRSLNDTYFHVLQLVEEEARPLRTLVIKCLMWSIYSRMYLRLYELREAVVVDETTTDIARLRHARQRYTTGDILDACRGLLVSDDDYYRDPLGGWSSTRIIHFSFWQFIMTDDRVLQTKFALLRDSDAVESELARVCISHLTHICLQDGPASSFDDLRIRIAGKNTPFAWYCARFFDEHAVTAGVAGDLQKALYKLLALEVSKLAALMQLRHMRKPNYRGDFRSFGSGVNARKIIETSRLVEIESIRNESRWKTLALYQDSIHQACATGRTDQVQHLIDLGADFNALDKHGETPFAVAIMRMRIDIVTVLLQAGVDVNQPIRRGETALEVSSRAGYEELVVLLLDSGATGIENDCTFTSALYDAVWCGQNEVAILLLSQGAKCTESLLLCAAEVGMTEVVRSCLHSGISPDGQVYKKPASENHRDWDSRPLYCAAKWGWADTTRLLLEYNADVSLVGGSFGTSLQAAALSGREDIMTLLLKDSSEALVNYSGGEYGTAVNAAAYNGQDSIVQLLLDAGADVNIPGGKYEYALVASVEIDIVKSDSATSSRSWMSIPHGLGKEGPKMEIHRGFKNATERLINAGANIAEQGEAALTGAIKNGHTRLVDLLLSKGARFNPQVFSTTIDSAPANLVKLMLQIGAYPNQADEDGKRPLVRAVQRDDSDIVKALIEGGADPNLSAEGKFGVTRPLHEACTKANLSLVNILLDADANTNLWGNTPESEKARVGYASGQAQGSALHAACSGGSLDHPSDRDLLNEPRANIVKLLLDKGAKADTPNENGWTALGLVCSRFDKDPNAYSIAKVLLDHGVDHHAPCGQYTSALEVAARRGYEEIVLLLLKVGLTDEHLKQNALQVAAEEGYKNIVRCLIDEGVDASVPLGNSTFIPVGDKPFYSAASNGQFDMVKKLIEAGANIHAHGHFGSVYETALVGHAFSYDGKGEWGRLIALLKQKGAEEPSATCYYSIRCNGPKCAGKGKFAKLYWFDRKSARPTDWVRGTRYKCEVCEDFNLCETCNDIFLEKSKQISYERRPSASPQGPQSENDASSQDHDDTSSLDDQSSDASYAPPLSHTIDHIINVLETRESLGVETGLGSEIKERAKNSPMAQLDLVHEVDAMDVELFS